MIPNHAVDEIMDILSTQMSITSDEIAEILKKYDVSGDMDALQDSYRKRLGQRLIAGILDEKGQRELLAVGNEYIIIDCCNDQKKLSAIQHKLKSSMDSLDESAQKVQGRQAFLRRFSSKKKVRKA